jgi:CRP-like cAMP-binding protein
LASSFFRYPGSPAEVEASPKQSLARLSEADWEHLISHAARRRYAAGAVIVEPRNAERAVFILVDGSARLEGRPGAPVGRAELNAGEAFGFEAFLAGAPNDARVTAVTAVEVLMLTEEGFEQLAAWRPRVAILLLRDLAGDLATRLQSIGSGPARGRR